MAQSMAAAMDVMLRLDASKLDDLRDFFMQHDDELPLDVFVSGMLAHFPQTTNQDNMIDTVVALCELFAMVDVDGNALMEWDEFTSFCIEAGIAAGKFKPRPKWRLSEHAQFAARTPHNIKVSRLRFLPVINKVIAVEDGTHKARVYDADVESLAGGLRLLCVVDFDAVDGGDGADATDVVYLPEWRVLVFAVVNFSLYFFDAAPLLPKSAATPEDDGEGSEAEEAAAVAPKFLSRCHTAAPQRVLAWDPTHKHLFGISSGSEAYVWELRHFYDADRRRGVAAVPLTRLLGHKQAVRDVVVVPAAGLAVTVGLDKTMRTWHLDSLKPAVTRREHRQGIRAAAYSPCADVLVTVGFDPYAMVWALDVSAGVPVFRLDGHTHPIVAVDLLATRPQCVTADEAGVFKLWDLRRTASITTAERCLQTFTTLDFQVSRIPFEPRSVTAVASAEPEAVVLGGARLKAFQFRRIEPEAKPPSVVLYNPVSLSFFAAAERDLLVIDAASGEVGTTFASVADSQVTCMAFDPRMRKVVVGLADGGLTVFNCLNGAVMKTLDPHDGEVSGMVYCQEDLVLITVGWDRAIRMHDEAALEGEILRVITDAHDTDIVAVAYSYRLGLVATGCRNGIIKVWDFQLATLERILPGHRGAISALTFVDPYPVLVSGDNLGGVCAWTVRPGLPRYRCIASFQNVNMDAGPGPHLRPGRSPPRRPASRSRTPSTLARATAAASDSVTGLTVLRDPLHDPSRGIPSVCVLACSDTGEIGVWDFEEVFRANSITACPDAGLPFTLNNYNARRKIERDGLRATVFEDHSVEDAPVVPAGGRRASRRMSGRPARLPNLKPARPHARSTASDPGIARRGSRVDPTPRLATPPSSRMDTASRTVVPQVRWWQAHHSAVTGMQWVAHPPCLVTHAFDGTLAVWDVFPHASAAALGLEAPAGAPEAAFAPRQWVLNVAGHNRQPRGAFWKFPADVLVKRQQEAQVMEAHEVLKRIATAADLLAETDHVTREPIVYEYEALKEQRRLRLMEVAAMAGLVTGLHHKAAAARHAVERRHVFAQLFGEANWKPTAGEVARKEAAAAVAEKSKERDTAIANFSRLKFGGGETKRRRRRKGGRKGAAAGPSDQTWTTLQQLDAIAKKEEFEALKAAEPAAPTLPDLDDPFNDQGISSRKKQVSLYPSLFSELAKSATGRLTTEPPPLSPDPGSVITTATGAPSTLEAGGDSPPPRPSSSKVPLRGAGAVTAAAIDGVQLAIASPSALSSYRPATGGASRRSGVVSPLPRLLSSPPNGQGAGMEAALSPPLSPVADVPAARVRRAADPPPPATKRGVPMHARQVPTWEQAGAAAANRALLRQSHSRADSIIASLSKLERGEKRRQRGARRRVARRRRANSQTLSASKSEPGLTRRTSVKALGHTGPGMVPSMADLPPGDLYEAESSGAESDTSEWAQRAAAVLKLASLVETGRAKDFADLSPRTRMSVLSEKYQRLTETGSSDEDENPAVRRLRLKRMTSPVKGMTVKTRERRSASVLFQQAEKEVERYLKRVAARRKKGLLRNPSAKSIGALTAEDGVVKLAVDVEEPVKEDAPAVPLTEDSRAGRAARRGRRGSLPGFAMYPRKEVADMADVLSELDPENTGLIHREAFVAAEAFKGGPLVRHGVESLFNSMGSGPTVPVARVLAVLFKMADRKTLDAITAFVRARMQANADALKAPPPLTPPPKPVSLGALSQMRQLFRVYDTDNSGTISVRELMDAFNVGSNLYGKKGAMRMENRMTVEDLEGVVALVDEDENRELDFDEFVTLMRSSFSPPSKGRSRAVDKP